MISQQFRQHRDADLGIGVGHAFGRGRANLRLGISEETGEFVGGIFGSHQPEGAGCCGPHQRLRVG